MVRHIAALVAAVALSMSVVACAANNDEGANAVGASAQDESAAATTSAKFEVFTGSDGQFYFHLVAANGEKMLESEGYTSKADAEAAISAVIANAPDARNVEVLASTNGQFYFTVRSSNGEVVATSETYTTKESAERGALIVRQITRILGEQQN